MEWLNLFRNWQELIGAFVGAFIAVLGAFLVSHNENHQKNIAERKRQYSNLLIALQDINRFISKCEFFLNSLKGGMIPYDKILLNDKINYIDPTQVFDLDSEVYTSIENIYSIANLISYNFKLSEVLEIEVEKKENKEIHRQKNVISNRYYETLRLVRFYLPTVYHQYNLIAEAIKKLEKKYKYLKFPENITFYERNYVEKQIQEYNLGT